MPDTRRVKRVEDFAAYLLGSPSDLQEILHNLHKNVLAEDNAVYVALTEKSTSGELFILGSSGLDQAKRRGSRSTHRALSLEKNSASKRFSANQFIGAKSLVTAYLLHSELQSPVVAAI
jgi:hypothetical protein